MTAAAAAPVAAAPAPAGYADSVDRALEILRGAPADDRLAARRAAAVLEEGTGDSQREILADLRRDPPDVADARARLGALAQADRSPAFVPEPARARRAVDDIMAQPRYAPLRSDQSLWDRALEAVGRALVWVFDQVDGAVSAGYGWVLFAAAAVLLAALALLVVRSARWLARREARVTEADSVEAAARDRFAEADRLAEAGDLAGAIRELAGGVAAALADDRTWDVSPLTVRELFGRAPDPAALRPLLLAFEASVYGDRPPAPDAYRRAAAAAAPFRPDGEARRAGSAAA
jgi:hypothetical protein